jgi:3-isopropylmalate/(R)-2-methylmalate dehydratase small subunit
VLRGRAIRLGDDVNTDLIIAGRYKFRALPIEELAKHVFEDLDPSLAGKIRPGDVVVAGRNFGCGSSREHAPRVLKAAGISAVVAKSFARIFFRNAINVGLPVVEAEARLIDSTEDGDEIEVDLRRGMVRNLSKGLEAEFKPYPPALLDVLAAGGLLSYVRSRGGLPWRGTR